MRHAGSTDYAVSNRIVWRTEKAFSAIGRYLSIIKQTVIGQFCDIRLCRSVPWQSTISKHFQNPVYTLQLLVQPVVTTVTSCLLTFSGCTSRLHVGQVSNMLNTCHSSCHRITQLLQPCKLTCNRFD
jgi:hypothetical protein